MERYSENRNCDASTQTENDNDRTVINDIPTQCVIRDNVKKNPNDIKHTKLGNDSDSILLRSNTDCSIASTKTVPGCDDIINKKVSTFIWKVLNNELPNNEQPSLVAMILSRRTARLAELHLEDKILTKSAEILCYKSHYKKQIDDIQMLKNVQLKWIKKIQSQAVQAGNVLYVSGSLGLDEKTLKPVEGGAAAEARQSLKNIHAILKHAGTSFDKIAKTTILLSDINNAKFVNEVYQEFVKEPYPARSTYQVAKLPLNALVEIEVIAIVE